MFNYSDFFFRVELCWPIYFLSAFFFFLHDSKHFQAFFFFYKSAYFFGIRNSGTLSQACYRIVEFLLALLGIHFSWASDFCNFYPPL